MQANKINPHDKNLFLPVQTPLLAYVPEGQEATQVIPDRYLPEVHPVHVVELVHEVQ